MMHTTFRRRPALPEGTYVELVRSVFATLTPTTIMGILFVIVSAFAARRMNDPLIVALCVMGTALSLLRVWIILWHERTVALWGEDRRGAVGAERRFGITYLAFAGLLGMFGARVFQVGQQDVQLVAAALLVGYAAGVAAGVSLRPWIALSSVLLSIVPTIIVAFATGDTAHGLLGIILSAFLAGGASSMVSRFRSETEKITMRRTFGDLARRDALTGLANRLGLADAHREAATSSPDCRQAVHCLDLDRFKAVNDRLGHPAGDELLIAVAGRLANLLRDGDLAARLGGDEFAVLQTGMRHAGEAELLARRISRAVSEPYSVGGETLSVGVSIGFVVSEDCNEALEDMLARADEASYRVKRRGGGAVEDGALVQSATS